MILERKVNYKDIERLGLVRLFDARIIREAVLNEDKNSLRELIFQVVEALNGLNIRMENFYYGEYIAMSDDLSFKARRPLPQRSREGMNRIM